ncbi:MAG: hypothetical protein ABWY22_02020, partial [Flavobacterium sp.]
PAFTINISQNNINETYTGKKIHQIEEVNFENLEVAKFLKAHRITDYNWDNKFTHSLLKVRFDTADDFQLKDILGELLIVNTNSLNYYSTFNGILCQRSFSVGFPETSENKFFIKPTESIQGLFPKWLSYFSSLNFTDKACLAITPDRCDFTIDEKYKILKSKIEKRIIEELDNHFTIFNNKNGATNTARYIDFLYISGFFGFDLDEIRNEIIMSEQAKLFFHKWISLPTLSSNGKIERSKASQIDLLENIGVIASHVDETQIHLLLDFKKNNNLEIILLGNFYHNSHRNETLLLRLLGSTKHFMKPIKLLLKPLAESPLYLHRYKSKQIEDDGEYDSLNFISNGESIHDETSVVFRIRNEYLHPQWNISNPLVDFLFSNPTEYSSEKKTLLHKLSGDIQKSFEKSIMLLKDSDNPDHIKIGYSDKTHVLTNNILNFNTDLFNILDVIFLNLWKDAQKIGILKDNNKYIGLKPENLPWFWNE